MSQLVDNKPVKLHHIFLTWKLEEHIANGNVRVQKHPTLPLVIYNYTEKCQIESNWDSCTNECRGLIVDSNTQEVIARPFRKFHNLNTKHVPESQADYLAFHFEGVTPLVTMKMDGSLGILFKYAGEWHVATRGSFQSEQAKWATKWIRKIEPRQLESLPSDYTYLFEIIYDENRIVVDYDFEGLVMLGAVKKLDGSEMRRNLLEFYASVNGFQVTPKFAKTIEQCAAENNKNEEGYVVTYLREGKWPVKVKVKFDEYCALHRVVTHMNPKSVWEMLAAGKEQELADLYRDANYPEKFRSWLLGWTVELEQRYFKIQDEAAYIVKAAHDAIGFGDSEKATGEVRKKYAMFFQAQNPSICGVMFAMLDGHDHAQTIWKMIKPKANESFVQED